MGWLTLLASASLSCTFPCERDLQANWCCQPLPGQLTWSTSSRPTDVVNFFSSLCNIYIAVASYLMQLSPFPTNLIIWYIYYHIIPVSLPLWGVGWGGLRGVGAERVGTVWTASVNHTADPYWQTPAACLLTKPNRVQWCGAVMLRELRCKEKKG